MGGSSEQTVGYKIYEGRHLALCKGPIDKIFWIKTDNKTAWTGPSTGGRITIDSPELYGGESREGGISGDVDFEQGLPTQGQNDYLLNVLGTSLLPAFRRICALVLRKIYIGLNPYPKPMLIRGQRVFTKGDGEVQWYPEKAGILIDGGGTPLNIEYEGAEAFPYETEVSIGESLGYISLTYTTGPNPDKFEIWFDGVKVVDTGYHGDESYQSALNAYLTAHSLPTETIIQMPGSAEDCWEQWDTVTDREQAIFFKNSSTSTMTLKAYSPLSGTAWVATVTADGDSATYDMNPSHVVRELLTDPDFGLGLSADEDIDDDLMTAVADTLYAEGMGVSFMYLNTTSVNDMVQEVLRHIDGVTVVDNLTGKIGIKLLRDDYDTESLVSLSPSNCKVSNFSRIPQSELINEVTVQYWDSITGTDKTVTVQNIALIQSAGGVNATKIEYPWFTNNNVAARAAARDLRTLGYPRASCTVTANRVASRLSKGDVFNLSYPKCGIANMVMRITDIDYGDGVDNKIVINCTQDTFSLPEIAFVTNSEILWESSKTAPSAAESRIAVELPYMALVNRQGQDAVDAFLTSYPEAGYIGATAERPGGSEINARLWTDSGGGYVEYGKVDFCPTAKLAASVGLPDGSATEEWSITNSVHADIVNAGTWGQVDDELFAIVSASSTSVTVIRAVLDTLPAEHASGSKIFFWSEYASSDEQQYELNDEVNVKLQTVSTSGVLPLANATADTVTIQQRAIRPYPPANVRINSNYWPDDVSINVTLSWNHRDKTQQTAGTYVGWFDDSVGPETGTTYTATWKLNGVTVSTATGITGTSTSYTFTQSGTASVELKSVLDGIDSFQVYTHSWDVEMSSADEYFSDVVLLLQPPSDATDGSTNITDESNSAHTVSVFGNAQIDTDIGYPSIKMDGNGDYLTIPDSPDFSMDDDFTVDVLFTTDTWDSGQTYDQYSFLVLNRQVSATPNNGWQIVISNYGTYIHNINVHYLDTYGNMQSIRSANYTIQLNTLHHVRMCRSGNIVRAFLDGNYLGQIDASTYPVSDGSENLRVGQYTDSGAYCFSGNLRVRITRAARNTTNDNFVPPTEFEDH